MKLSLGKSQNCFSSSRVFLGICLVVLILYYPSLQGEFTIDSRHVILNNPTIKQPLLYPRIFLERFFASYPKKDIVSINYYRPVVLLSYILDYRIWQVDPLGYRLTNILIHVGNAFLLFLLLGRIFDKFSALLCALVFAVLPVHEWNINHISARTTLLQTFFSLLSGLFLLEFWEKGKKKNLFIALTFFVLALFSREMAVFWIFNIFIIGFYLREKNKDLLFSSLPFVGVIILYGGFRLFFLPIVSSLKPFSHNIAITLLKGMALCVEKMTHFFMPRTTKLLYIINFEKNLFLLVGSLVFIILLGGTIYLFFVKRNRFGFAGMWVFSGFLPLFFAIPQVKYLGPILSDNYLYLPAMGFCMLMAFFLKRMSPSKHIIGVSLIAVYFAGQTVYANIFWRSEKMLFPHIAKLEGKRGHLVEDEIIERLYPEEGALKIKIQRSRFPEEKLNWLVSLGQFYIQKGKTKKALAVLEEAKEIAPFSKRVLRGEGLAYYAGGEYKKAEALLKQAFAKDQQDYYTLLALGRLYYYMSKFPKSISYLERALFYNPDSAEALTYLGMDLWWVNKVEDFNKTISLAVRKSKDPYGVYYFISYELFRHHEYIMAVTFLRGLVMQFPKDIRPCILLSELYSGLGRPDMAKKLWEDFLRKNPHALKAKWYLRQLEKQQKEAQ